VESVVKLTLVTLTTHTYSLWNCCQLQQIKQRIDKVQFKFILSNKIECHATKQAAGMTGIRGVSRSHLHENTTHTSPTSVEYQHNLHVFGVDHLFNLATSRLSISIEHNCSVYDHHVLA
jgi:hypothetical protein